MALHLLYIYQPFPWEQHCGDTHKNHNRTYMPMGMGYKRIVMLKSIANKDFQTWHLVGWQHSRQPTRSHGGKSLLITRILTWILFSNPGPRVLLYLHSFHYGDVIMGTVASEITSITIVYSTVYSGADQREYQSSASLVFVWGIHRGPVNSPHKWPVKRKMFPFDDVIMFQDEEYICAFVS